DSDLLNPIARYLKQILLNLWMLRIKLRHERLEREGIIGRYAINNLKRPLPYMEPICVFGLLAMLLCIDKRCKGTSRMIENSIQQYSNSASMTCVNELFKLFIRTKVRVYL